jgi:hypothetical protein
LVAVAVAQDLVAALAQMVVQAVQAVVLVTQAQHLIQAERQEAELLIKDLTEG